MWIGNFVRYELGPQSLTRWRKVWCYEGSRTTKSRVCGKSYGVLLWVHVLLGNLSPTCVLDISQDKGNCAYLNFMLDSTSSKSLNPIPHGLPGVASSMKRPNSGWNIGRVLRRFRREIEATILHTLICQLLVSLARSLLHP